MRILALSLLLLTGCTVASLKQDYQPLTTSVPGEPRALAECMLNAIDVITYHAQRVDLRVLPNKDVNVFTHLNGEIPMAFSIYEFRAIEGKTTLTTWHAMPSDKAKSQFVTISKALTDCAKTAGSTASVV